MPDIPCNACTGRLHRHGRGPARGISKADRVARYRELAKLYEAVGTSILNRDDYPTAETKTDWSLGTGVRIIREDHDADYALSIYLRDQYESGGRGPDRGNQ